MYLILRRDKLFAADGYARGWTSGIPGVTIFSTLEEAQIALKKKQERIEDDLVIVKVAIVIEEVNG